VKNKLCPNCQRPMFKSGNKWCCAACGATAPLRSKPSQAPNTSLRLSEPQREWLKATYGGIQPGIKALIDEAMSKEA